MLASVIARCASAALIAAFTLAGCGGSQSIGTPATTTQMGSTKHRAFSSGQALLFSISGESGTIADYPSGTIVDTFWIGSYGVAGCTDSQGNVYVGGSDDTNNEPFIAEYPYGATSPSEYVLITPQSQYAVGAVWGCRSIQRPAILLQSLISDNAKNDSVAIFAPQLQGTPQIYSNFSMGMLWSASYDGSGNLFLLGGASNIQDLLFEELAKDAYAFQPLSLDLGRHLPKRNPGYNYWMTQWDGQYVTVDGPYSPKPNGKAKTWKGAIYRLNISGSAATVKQTTLLQKVRRYDVRSRYCIVPVLGRVIISGYHPESFDYPSGKNLGKLPISASSAVIALPPSR